MTKPATKLLYEDTRLAKMLQTRIDKLAPNKSQKEIAQEIGYDKPNVVSMYKRGEAKVPLDKLPDFARVLGLDLALLFRAGLEQWWPKATVQLSQMFFERIVTKNERNIIACVQKASGEDDPDLTPELEGVIEQYFAAKKESQKNVSLHKADA